MSLNDISLPSQLIADLYRRALVGSVAPAPQRPPVPFLGRNAKNILLVANNPDVDGVTDEELAFLTRVLQACSLGLADVAIVNRGKAPYHDAEAIMEQFDARVVVLFDVSPELFGLPADTSFYTITDRQSRRYMTAPSLNAIEKSKEAKSRLWAGLKQLFCI